MVIAIDGYEANINNRVGIGRYAFEIIKHMYELRAMSYELQTSFRIYLPSEPLADMPKETSWWQYRIIPAKRLWTFFSLPLGVFFDTPKADVVFSPTHYIPRGITTPRVMSLMDTSYLLYPTLFRKKDLIQLTRGTAYSVKHSAQIITISEYSKNAIIKAYGVDPQKITVTYPGRTMHMNTDTNGTIEKTYHIEKPYILTVGTLQPRKNFVALIEAFSVLKKTHAKAKPLTLVIVGKKGWLYEEIVKAPDVYGVQDSVRFLDFVPDSDLPALYKHALCFALPSLYEGFGLPVLEAMAFGCPTVVSNVSSIPEIAGEAGIYVDPNNIQSIAKGLAKALDESGTQKGKARIEKGKKQAKKFTWEHAAKQTLEVLKSVHSS